VSPFDLEPDNEEHGDDFLILSYGYGEVARYCAKVAFFYHESSPLRAVAVMLLDDPVDYSGRRNLEEDSLSYSS
jgi:hypothetical protein